MVNKRVKIKRVLKLYITGAEINLNLYYTDNSLLAVRANNASFFLTAKEIIDLILGVSEKHIDVLLRCPLYSNQICMAHRERKRKSL